MDENIQYLAEVLVKPEIKKNRTINPMAITGGRMISMEELPSASMTLHD